MSTYGPLTGCVSSLRSSMALLDSSISILDSGVNDFPRLSKVLQTTRHFELTSESSLQSAQESLVSEIRPEVDILLSRVGTHLDKLERREANLMAKYDLQAGRLNQDPPPGRPSSRGASAFAVDDGEGATPTAGKRKERNPLEELKMKHLRQKRERLSYAVERLTLQAQQRERQLRMSMAAPQRMGEEPGGDFDDF